MSIDPRTPVLVGQGQIVNHIAKLSDAREPAHLIADAIREATTDANLISLPEIDALHIVRLLSWKYTNPAFTVASRLGLKSRAYGITPHGGNMPQLLINKLAQQIQRGELDIAVVAGGEASNSRARAHRENATLNWSESGADTPTAENIIDDAAMSNDAEIARKIVLPIQIYPMFETAIRAEAKHDINQHEQLISELWSRFSNVASTNNFAWSNTALTAEQVRKVTPKNRMIGLPYRKVMNSNNQVNLAAAVVMCSAERAAALGVPRDRWIFPWAGTDCHEHQFVSNRWSFAETPAIQLGGQRALQLAGLSIDDIAHIDLYSCFPSAVQLGAASLGLDLRRQLTLTGGLSFAGGPWNNYVMHAIATAMLRLRESRDEHALIWANGGYATKHAFGVYATTPPPNGFCHESPQAAIDALPARQLAIGDDARGAAIIEAYTVMHDRNGAPERLIAAAILADGRRAWINVADEGLARDFATGEQVGRRVVLRRSGELESA